MYKRLRSSLDHEREAGNTLSPSRDSEVPSELWCTSHRTLVSRRVISGGPKFLPHPFSSPHVGIKPRDGWDATCCHSCHGNAPPTEALQISPRPIPDQGSKGPICTWYSSHRHEELSQEPVHSCQLFSSSEHWALPPLSTGRRTPRVPEPLPRSLAWFPISSVQCSGSESCKIHHMLASHRDGRHRVVRRCWGESTLSSSRFSTCQSSRLLKWVEVILNFATRFGFGSSGWRWGRTKEGGREAGH